MTGPCPDAVVRLPVDGRKINYLRISVTDRCNLACRYCVPKETLPELNHRDIARYEEILCLVRILRRIGITKLRITGGEPLVRKGILPFLREAAAIPGIEDVSLTTNGTLLKRYIGEIAASGLRRINISLDTLRPEKFRWITGHDMFDQVWEGIMAAHALGISPIKLNAVVLAGVNHDEIGDLAALSRKYPFHIRYIEYMPMGNSAVTSSQRILIPEIKTIIENRFGPLEAVPRQLHDGPARRFKIPGAPGEIGFISPVSSHFCSQCNRLRLTSVGRLRPCLLNSREYDLLSLLRNGADEDRILGVVREGIRNKPGSHTITPAAEQKVLSQMSAIGG